MGITVSGRQNRGPAAAVPPATAFTLRSTKPDASNTGVGVLRPLSGRVIDIGDTSVGTWSNDGVLTPSGDIVDSVVRCKGVARGREDWLFENNDVQGVGVPSGGRNLIQCGGSFTTQARVRFNTVHSTVTTQLFNGIGGRNILAERNNVHHVTDMFSPSLAAGSLDANLDIQGNYGHDHLFYAPDPGHPDGTPTTAADGTVITGPWAGQGWNHCDGLQLEPAGITGIRSVGNHYDARWANDSISVQPLPNARKELSVFMLNAGTGFVSEDDWFNGGEYVVNNAPTNVTGWIKRGKFGPDLMINPKTGRPFALMLSSNGLLTYDGGADQNHWVKPDGSVVPLGRGA